MAGIKGMKIGKSVTLVKPKGTVIIIENVITTDELEKYLERRENRLFGRQKEVETERELERRFKQIEEKLSDKTRLLELVLELALKEDFEGITEEEKRLKDILTKVYLMTN